MSKRKRDADTNDASPTKKIKNTSTISLKNPTTKKPPTFLTLPLEIRQKILIDALEPPSSFMESCIYAYPAYDFTSLHDIDIELVAEVQSSHLESMDRTATNIRLTHPQLVGEVKYCLKKAKETFKLDFNEASGIAMEIDDLGHSLFVNDIDHFAASGEVVDFEEGDRGCRGYLFYGVWEYLAESGGIEKFSSCD